MSVIEELKSQTGNFNIEGIGTVSVTTNSATVTGNGTAFTAQDENPWIVIASGTYVIKTVQDPQMIALTAP